MPLQSGWAGWDIVGEQRIQKILAQWGLASRREAERAIAAGRVRINGQVARLGQVADPDRDRLEWDGRWVQPDRRPDLIYLLLNKPAGMISACWDDRDRPVVLDCLPPAWREGRGIHPVGRLDWDSTGALILTNDGALTFGLTHPRFHVPKTYEVWVAGWPTAETIDRWRQGVVLDDRSTLPAQVRVLAQTGQGVHGLSQRGDRGPRDRSVDRYPWGQEPATQLQIILNEGRNRQIRRTADLLGHPVLALHRTAIGPVQLAKRGQLRLGVGQYRDLTDSELNALRRQIL